jgi:hypothetical protein
MNFIPAPSDELLSIYLTLGQYPILNNRIRARMRKELFSRGVITIQQFEAEVRQAAIRSQTQEGLTNPYGEESPEVWDLRLLRVRDQLTDLVFSQHLPFEVFQKLVTEVLGERGINMQELMLSLNPELAPQEMVLEQGMMIEKLPVGERARYEARLQETKVVLIRSMISDQLRYINIAKEWFTISDLAEIRRRKIGAGRIGGKSAGMLLAYRILRQVGSEALTSSIRVPESYYIGSDEMYTFMAVNNLVHWNDQKYKSEEDMRADYPLIVKDYEAGVFSPENLEKLQVLLVNVGNKPLIVRSSSLLEDNFGTSFAGKYESIFLPNQGSIQQNLKALTQAIVHIYATTLNPTALLYRRSKGLQDYDERMAILIQEVIGGSFGRYYLPHAAGVAFSRNLYRWAPQIRREDGFVRLVWGLGTRAVDRVGNEYPRLVALSHPLLRPSTDPKAIRRYSQQYVDLIDLQDNQVKTLPIHDVLNSQYPPLRYLAQLDEEGYFISLRSSLLDGDPRSLVLTFDDLLRRTPFAERMRELLTLLERNYHSPVDIEFALRLDKPETGKPELRIAILQCRPQSHLVVTEQVPIPPDLSRVDIVFSTRFVVPQGHIDQVKYVVFVPHEGYFALPTAEARRALARTIGKLNAALKDEQFICIGPGRWGSTNSDLGVPVDFGDIYHTRALVELSGPGIGPDPEPSLGTHFFQDLLESQIFPLAVSLADSQAILNQKFFYDLPNHLLDWILANESTQECLRLIHVSDYRPGHHLKVVMNDDKGLAVAFMEKDTEQTDETQ